MGFTILSSVSVTASGAPLPSRAQPTSLPPSFHCDDIVLGREAVQSSSLSARFTFLLGTMTSLLPWKFHLPSCVPTSVPVVRVPIKKGSQLSVSTEHSRVLKLFGSEFSAAAKLPLCRDHEALHDCPLSPRASGCLLLSSAIITK